MIISIIVPVYGVEPYIRQCLLSVISQTVTDCVECILVNDCTLDNSMSIINDVLSTYQGNIKFRVINREFNGGLSAARNSGIKEAVGEYLYFLDSDDTIEPTCLQQLLHTVMKFPKSEIILQVPRQRLKVLSIWIWPIKALQNIQKIKLI